MIETGSAKVRQFGKYRLIAHLATGGMAEIYLATYAALAGFEKLVVIKRILPNLARDPRFVQMFLDEARIAALVNHPNVVQIFELGKIEEQYFIAMEYLSGESLAAVITSCRRQSQKLNPELAAGIVLQAADGLHHAHTLIGKDGTPLHIVHRDVSPQNVFVLYDGGVKLVDFGIAKAALRSTHTRTGTLKGKLSYMSPEQILHEELDGRSDVFALGIVLWEALTARKLFRNDSELKLLQSITDEDAPSPVSVNPEVPPALAQITLKALARDRAQRYQTAAEMRADLARFLKSCEKDADSAAISKFMQLRFADRISRKRQVLEHAHDVNQDLTEYLADEWNRYVSDTQESVPISTPDLIGDQPFVVRRNWRRPLILPLAIAALTSGGIVLGAAMARFVGVGRETVVVAARPATPPPVVGAPDAGGREDAGTVVQAGQAADAGQPDRGAVQGPVERAAVEHGRTRKRQKRSKVATAHKGAPVEAPEPAEVKEPLGPPGKLRLTTNPWTRIYYEGRKLGETPLVDVELPSGKIKLRAVNQEAGIDRTIIVEIKPGERVTKRFNFL